MKLKFNRHLIWKLPLFISLIVSCTELELTDQSKLNVNSLSLDSRTFLSKNLKDSTLRAENLVKSNVTSTASQETLAAPTATSVNYALQATVSAESTFSGYSDSILKTEAGLPRLALLIAGQIIFLLEVNYQKVYF
jgi:hypothetical protein